MEYKIISVYIFSPYIFIFNAQQTLAGACSKGRVMNSLEVSSGHITLPLLSAVQL